MKRFFIIFISFLLLPEIIMASSLNDFGIADGANCLIIPKTIILHNDTLTSVYTPNITYSFSIAPAAVNNLTVIDNNSESRVISQGVVGGASLGNGGQIIFTS